LGVFLGFIVALICMLGGYAAMGGHVFVLWQPSEFIIIGFFYSKVRKATRPGAAFQA
jgi:flagellar motor component MotA